MKSGDPSHRTGTMKRLHTALTALLAVIFSLQVPLCAAACSGPGTSEPASAAAVAAGADSHPCHGEPEPVEEPVDCSAHCLHEAQAGFTRAKAIEAPPSFALHTSHETAPALLSLRKPAPASFRPIPPPRDLLLLKSTLLL
jgi:hypothetical protein